VLRQSVNCRPGFEPCPSAKDILRKLEFQRRYFVLQNRAEDNCQEKQYIHMYIHTC
jgi:hypothetical protein